MPDGHVAVALYGEIDIATAPVMRDVLAKVASHAATGLTVDLSGVTFLDAAGLGMLVSASRSAQHLPGGLRLVGVPARVLRLLRLTRLHRLASVPVRAAPEPTSTRVMLLRLTRR